MYQSLFALRQFVQRGTEMTLFDCRYLVALGMGQALSKPENYSSPTAENLGLKLVCPTQKCFSRTIHTQT